MIIDTHIILQGNGVSLQWTISSIVWNQAASKLSMERSRRFEELNTSTSFLKYRESFS
jgi:hypothetical protein